MYTVFTSPFYPYITLPDIYTAELHKMSCRQRQKWAQASSFSPLYKIFNVLCMYSTAPGVWLGALYVCISSLGSWADLPCATPRGLYHRTLDGWRMGRCISTTEFLPSLTFPCHSTSLQRRSRGFLYSVYSTYLISCR